MLRSIAKQLSLKSSNVPEEAMKQISNFYQSGERPNIEKLTELIQMLVKSRNSSFVIVDALDECRERALLLKTIKLIQNLELKGLYLLVTSRDLIDIRRVLGIVSDIEIHIGSPEQETGINNDILVCIERGIANKHYLAIRSDKIKSKVKQTLVEKAGGMYVIIATLLTIILLVMLTFNAGFVGYLVKLSCCLNL